MGYILIIGGPNTGKLKVVETICRRELEEQDFGTDTHSGLIFDTNVKNKYYEAQVKLMVDEFPDQRKLLDGSQKYNEKLKVEHFSKWIDELKLEEFKELRENLNMVIATIDLRSESPEYIECFMECLSRLQSMLEIEVDDLSLFVVLSSEIENREAENTILQYGIEYVYLTQKGKNEFGENIGRNRILEILENYNWNGERQMPNIPSTGYERNRFQKMKQMSQKLLENDGAPADKFEDDSSNVLDIDYIVNKLRDAKERASEMNLQEKEEYTKAMVNEILDFI